MNGPVPTEEPTADPAVQRFREHVASTLREGTPLATLLDYLLEDATQLGLDQAQAVALIEQVDAEIRARGTVPIRLAYDVEHAATGVAFGNTIVALQVASATERAIQTVRISVEHPLTGELVVFPVLRTINKGSVKQTETDLVFERVGRHSIRRGWVEVQMLSGATHVFQLEDVIRLNAENHEAARAHIQTISQTIQTHGGGVVSAGSVGDGAPRPETRWQALRLGPSTVEALRQAERAGAATAVPEATHETPAVRVAEAVAPVVPVVPVAPATSDMPAAPSQLTAVAQSPTSVLLTWTDHATNEAGFHVDRSTDGNGFALMATLGPEATSFVATGLVPGSNNVFRVRAFNATGASAHSNVAAIRLPPLPEATVKAKATRPVNPSPGVSVQQRLAAAILSVYSDAVVKKIDQDHVLDIFVPSVCSRRTTNLTFKTARGVTRVYFYCRSAELVERVLLTAKSVERWHWGLMLIGDPAFMDPDDAIQGALAMLEDIAAADGPLKATTVAGDVVSSAGPTRQDELAAAVLREFPDAVVKKINVSDGFYMHLPSVNRQWMTHLMFNTASEHVFFNFYVRDSAFIASVLSGGSELEATGSVVRLVGNPKFATVADAATAAVRFVRLLESRSRPSASGFSA